MSLYKQIIANEVYHAVGCTEPISCAYAAAVAAYYLKEKVDKIHISVDQGTFN